jgi:ubiquinone/menaquinone biosynthesis C-methylase UbiE
LAMTHEYVNVNTRWAQRLQCGEQPNETDLREHLLAVHQRHAGFTESCAGRCRDARGRNSYEWLAETIDPSRHRQVLDLACGSGVLTALCHQRYAGQMAFIGVDMSAHELLLARQRIPDETVIFHRGLAQEMDFIPDASIDVVLCHWALPLMDPLQPVLDEVRRVLRPGGVFAAIVDGDLAAAPGYGELHHLIYGWVQQEYPSYGTIELGDTRVRTTAALEELVQAVFDDAQVQIEPAVVSLHAAPDTLAREAAGFFYASFVLSASVHAQMLSELEALFTAQKLNGQSRFAMPINRLLVRQPPDDSVST